MAVAGSDEDRWFRPHFLVDERVRVCTWPQATASALDLSADDALGRPCWDLLGGRDCRQHGRLSDEDGCDGGFCARLTTPTGQGRRLVWADLNHLCRGASGSSMLEATLVCGVLAQKAVGHDLDATLETIRRACGADDCELFLLEPECGEVALRGCAGADREAFLQQTRMPLGYGYPGMVTQTCEPVCTGRFEDDERFRRDAVKRRGIHTFIGVPVVDQGRSLGYLGVAWKHASIPLSWGLHLLRAVQPLALAAVRRIAPVAVPARPGCAVRGLGALTLVLGAQALTQQAFARRKSFDLLRHLLLARGAALPRIGLTGRLWPEVDAGIAANRLHVTLHALRQVLEQALPGRGAALIQHRHGGYRLDAVALGAVDLYQFLDGVDLAREHSQRGEVGAALAVLEQVLPLYRGDLFADSDDPAFEAPRQRYRRSYHEALRMLVDLYLREDRVDAALAALAESRERAPADADWHDLLSRQLIERRQVLRSSGQRPPLIAPPSTVLS